MVSAVNRGNIPSYSQGRSPLVTRTPNPIQFQPEAIDEESKVRSLQSWAWDNLQRIGKGVLRGVYITFISNGILMNINNAVREFFHHSEVIQSVTESLNKVFDVIDFAEILLVPIALSNIGHDIYGLVKGEITVAEFLLSLGENLGFIVLSVVELLKLLIKLAIISLETLKYLTPFSLIKVVLDGINIISSVKGWVENYRFAKEMRNELKGIDGKGEKDYRRVFEYLCNENEVSNQSISKFFGVEATSLRDRIKEVVIPALGICENNNPYADDKTWAELMVKDAYRALKGRVKANIVSHQLGLTNAAVNAVVHSVLFASPFIIAACPVAAPILPTCFAISGASACIALSKFIYDIVKQKQFQNSVLFDDTLVSTRRTKQTISARNFGQMAVT